MFNVFEGVLHDAPCRHAPLPGFTHEKQKPVENYKGETKKQLKSQEVWESPAQVS